MPLPSNEPETPASTRVERSGALLEETALSGAQAAEGVCQAIHDFGNKLTRVLGLAELLRVQPGLAGDPDRVREVAEAIIAAAAEASEGVVRLQSVYGAGVRPERARLAGRSVVEPSAAPLSRPLKVDR